ncbi:MAG TPA: aminoacyl-tRNA hydrolase [Dehalococcoidia bacterium]|nr:aminoacyl-tRNA hydrolase [Dehalococcoidia bacterium]
MNPHRLTTLPKGPLQLPRKALRRFRRAEEPERAVEWLIVGLGNPGAHYAEHRHNIGFRVVNRLARRHDIDVKAKGKLAAIGQGEIEGLPVALAKPRTYVNRSDEAIVELMRRYQVAPQRLLAVYDELDLPVGRVRIGRAGGHGGHNGMRPVVAAIGTDFPRIRIGIGRPLVDGEPSWDPDVIAAYVLSQPPPEEREVLDAAVAKAAEAIESIVRDGVEAAMNRFNRG